MKQTSVCRRTACLKSKKIRAREKIRVRACMERQFPKGIAAFYGASRGNRRSIKGANRFYGAVSVSENESPVADWISARAAIFRKRRKPIYGAASSVSENESTVENLISARSALFQKRRKPTLWRSSSVHFGGRIADGGFDFRASGARRWNRGSGNAVGRAAQKPAQNEGHFGKRAL